MLFHFFNVMGQNGVKLDIPLDLTRGTSQKNNCATFQEREETQGFTTKEHAREVARRKDLHR